MVAHPNVDVRPSRGPHNSLLYFGRDVSRWRVAWNYAWVSGAKSMPWFVVKRFMWRMAGAKVGKHVAIGLGAQLDVLFPGRVTLEDDVLLGYNCTLLAHGYVHDEYHIGPVQVGRGASIGANATVLPGVTIGAGAIIGAGSVVTRDVPPGEFWAGVPARPVKRGRKTTRSV